MAANKQRRTPKRARELGITDTDYHAMLEAQHGVCAICGNPPKTRRLHVDHNHRTNRVRGLLCFQCNRNLPTYATTTWLKAALTYIEDDEQGQWDTPDQWANTRKA